ncbi:GNAT family N-acetyltransferase [Clostridium saccharobutylicum]|uniref:Acetyltransferase (GNAT) family protein n=1 Tax=Clostridium saccharobutylicum TaxID=169679 RepID=A0A1S8NBN3_CLOSA|nr:GNAT family N-acetyltransferase [Clostridium saccharobutylicum]OOM13894.1 acetyltransferase (GNAT) family protein [Clostridium saccharobutylicum]
MNIRTATIEDSQDITAVESRCFPAAEAASESDFKKRLTVYPNHFWLLEDDGKLVGFVNGMVTNESILRDEMFKDANLHNENGQWQMIFGVNTVPEYRRKGYAEKIINKVIYDAKEQGRMGLVLTCKEKLLHYYAKFGFKNEGISESTHGGVIWYDMRLTF